MRILRIVCFLAVFLPPLQAQDQPSPKGRTLPGSSHPSAAPAKTSVMTAECRIAVARGTKWLMSALHRRGVGVDVNQPPDMSCTAIVGLALLSQGNTSSGGTHSRELRQILDLILNRIDELPDNYHPEAHTLIHRKIGKNSDLFLSALFLSQMLGDSGSSDREIRRCLEKLVRFISEGQGKDGTWGNDSWAPVLGTVLGWESLRASNSCGLKIEASAELAGKALLERLKAEQNSPNEDWMHKFYKEAASIRVLYSMGYRNDPIFEEAVTRVVDFVQSDTRPFIQAGGEEYLAFSLITECLIQNPRDSWKPWYPSVSKKLIRVQNGDGSWSGHHCITARTFCTAAAIMTLQAPDRCLPISDL